MDKTTEELKASLQEILHPEKGLEDRELLFFSRPSKEYREEAEEKMWGTPEAVAVTSCNGMEGVMCWGFYRNGWIANTGERFAIRRLISNNNALSVSSTGCY